MIYSLINASITASFSVMSVSFTYQPTLGVPLIIITGVNNAQFVNMTVSRISQGSSLSNAEAADLCDTRTNAPALDLRDSVASVMSSTFQGIDSGVCFAYVLLNVRLMMMIVDVFFFLVVFFFFEGAIRIRAGSVTLANVAFINNIMQRISEFPSLRHNVFVSGRSSVTVDSLRTDTSPSNFIYLSYDNGIPNVYSVDANGVPVSLNTPLFVPELVSIAPVQMPSSENTEFTFTGNRLYPCGLQVNIYKSNVSNLLQV
jgi:hypothetical protein